jgi:hypothetical protein
MRRESVLDEQQAPIWFEHAAHLVQCALDVADAAHRPSRHHRVDGSILQRNGLGRALDQVNRGTDVAYLFARHGEELRRGIEPYRSRRREAS